MSFQLPFLGLRVGGFVASWKSLSVQGSNAAASSVGQWHLLVVYSVYSHLSLGKCRDSKSRLAEQTSQSFTNRNDMESIFWGRGKKT